LFVLLEKNDSESRKSLQILFSHILQKSQWKFRLCPENKSGLGFEIFLISMKFLDLPV